MSDSSASDLQMEMAATDSSHKPSSENPPIEEALVKVRSPLPEWFPRRPLQDITQVLNQIQNVPLQIHGKAEIRDRLPKALALSGQSRSIRKQNKACIFLASEKKSLGYSGQSKPIRKQSKACISASQKNGTVLLKSFR